MGVLRNSKLIVGFLTVLPTLLQPSGMAVELSLPISAAITAIYVMILIGRKRNLDKMKAAAEQPKIKQIKTTTQTTSAFKASHIAFRLGDFSV